MQEHHISFISWSLRRFFLLGSCLLFVASSSGFLLVRSFAMNIKRSFICACVFGWTNKNILIVSLPSFPSAYMAKISIKSHLCFSRGCHFGHNLPTTFTHRATSFQFPVSTLTTSARLPDFSERDRNVQLRWLAFYHSNISEILVFNSLNYYCCYVFGWVSISMIFVAADSFDFRKI